MLKTSALIFFFSCLFVFHGHGAPLGTIPTVEELNLRFTFDFRSDLWTSPYTYKSAPIRFTNAEVRVPLAHAETWKASLEVSEGSLRLGRSDISLGEKRVFVGSDLRTQSVGLGLKRDFSNGTSLTLFGSYRSASDTPFGADRDKWVEGSVMYSSQKIENHRWLVAVNYSKNRGFLNKHPFPYFGVIYEPTPEFTAIFGFPFLRLIWAEREGWAKELRFTPFGVDLKLERDIGDGFHYGAFAGFNMHSYLHEERIEDDLRLYYMEAYLENRLKKRLSETTDVIFGLGYSFDRRLYESKSIYKPNSAMTRIDNDFYGRVLVEFRL